MRQLSAALEDIGITAQTGHSTNTSQHGSTRMDGKTNGTHYTNPPGVTIKDKNQATWIRCKMQGSGQQTKSIVSWTQVIRKMKNSATSMEILDEFPQGSHMTPRELKKMYPDERIGVFMRKEIAGTDLATTSDDQ